MQLASFAHPKRLLVKTALAAAVGFAVLQPGAAMAATAPSHPAAVAHLSGKLSHLRTTVWGNQHLSSSGFFTASRAGRAHSAVWGS